MSTTVTTPATMPPHSPSPLLLDTLKARLLTQLEQLIQKNFAISADDLKNLNISLELPPDLTMGDFAYPTFKLSKLLRKAPPVIAAELLKQAQADSTPAWAEILNTYAVSVAGPYLNFLLKPETLIQRILPALTQIRDTIRRADFPYKTMAIDFSSPNIAKPFNIFHLRSTMIGNCLSRVYTARGGSVIRINHLGDWGTQNGKLALAYQLYGDDAELEARGISYLVELYVRINKETEEDPALLDQARALFARLEKHDPEIYDLWKRFCEISIREIKKTYTRLNVEFDHYWGESHYLNEIPAVETLLNEKSLLVESEGAQVVDLSAFDMPPCIVRKQDGSTIYATRDLAAAMYRYNQFHFDRMIYVVGGEQKLHFAQVFKVLQLAGQTWANRLVHLDFGLYRFKDAKMSTRRGNFVTLESVLDEAVAHVKTLMEAKSPPQTTEDRALLEHNAELIGVAAVIFNDLSTDRDAAVNFDPQAIADFEGETGPYILYAHTRCLSIVRNAPSSLTSALKSAPTHLLTTAEELNLIRMMARLPLVLDLLIEHHKPHVLGNFLIDLTKSFNVFYRAHKVLVEDTELARARLHLVDTTQRVLQFGLELLGIRTPTKM